MKLFKSFGIILLVGIISSFCPFLYLSALLGFPAVLLNSLLLTFIFRKQLGE